MREEGPGGADSTRAYKMPPSPSSPPPSVKKLQEFFFFSSFPVQEGLKEKEMNGERNAGDKRALSAGEWEC